MIKAGQEYNQRNEFEHRDDVERELANKYDKRQDIVIPFGKKLGFNGTGGEQVTLQYDSSAFKIVINGLTVVELGTASSITTLAGRVTTAEGEIDTAQSAIITNAASISTVDGKLTASYGLTVDSNGRIASMKLLSNGTTSSVKFLATTFSVYDGTSDVATFEVSGGNVYIAGSKVRTESVVANALTTGSDFEDDSSVSIGGVGVWTDIASATVSTLDATTRVLVNWAAYIGGSDDGTVCDARISRNGTVVWGPCTVAGNPPDFSYTFDTEGLIEYQPLFNGMVSAFDADVPGSAGSYTYTLQMTTNNTGGPQWGASFRRLFALVFKR